MSFVIRNSSNAAYTTTTGSPNVTIPAATQSGITGGTGFVPGKILVSDANGVLLFTEVQNKNYLQIAVANDSSIVVGSSYVIQNSSTTAYTTTTGNPNVTVPAATLASGGVGTGYVLGSVVVSGTNANLLFTEVTNKNYLQLIQLNNAVTTVNYGDYIVANPTLPAASLVDGVFDLSGQTTAQTVTFDTAANVYAVLQQLPSTKLFTPATGLTPTKFEVKIFNNHTASGAITLAAGTGNTLAGVGTIAIGTGVIARAVLTVTSGTPAITYTVSVN
jgi:hypothetical protein